MLEPIKRGWLTVPWELQGPETERTIFIEHSTLHLSDNEITEILRPKSTYYVCFTLELPRRDGGARHGGHWGLTNPHFERPVVWRANEGGQKISGQLVDDQWIYLPGSFVW